MTEYFVSEVQEVYDYQVLLLTTNIETIVRQMLKKVEIKDPGESELLQGEIIDLIEITKLNSELKKIIKKPQHMREFY